MPNWLGNLVNSITRKREFRKLSKKLRDLLLGLNPEIVEDFLILLLNVMSLALWINKDYRRNIEGFRGKYKFTSKDRKICVSAVFKRSPIFNGDYLKVSDENLSDADVTVIFKNSKALMSLLLSPKPDILGTLLRDEVSVAGDVNYIFKLGFMATQLGQMVLSEGA